MEAWGGALLRAMAGDASLQWSGQTLYRGTAPVALAAAHQSDVPAELLDQRGLLDGASLRLRLSDAGLHVRHLPGDPVERLVFELLEQLRVESLKNGPAHAPTCMRALCTGARRLPTRA
jgi:cobaltochelatase CobT